ARSVALRPPGRRQRSPLSSPPQALSLPSPLLPSPRREPPGEGDYFAGRVQGLVEDQPTGNQWGAAAARPLGEPQLPGPPSPTPSQRVRAGDAREPSTTQPPPRAGVPPAVAVAVAVAPAKAALRKRLRQRMLLAEARAIRVSRRPDPGGAAPPGGHPWRRQTA